jgi:hypothetical protein
MRNHGSGLAMFMLRFYRFACAGQLPSIIFSQVKDVRRPKKAQNERS